MTLQRDLGEDESLFYWETHRNVGHWVSKLHVVSWYSAPHRLSVISYFWDWKPPLYTTQTPLPAGFYQWEALRWDSKMGGKQKSFCFRQWYGWECRLVVFCSTAAAFSGICDVRSSERHNFSLSPSPSIFLQFHVFGNPLLFLICTPSPSSIFVIKSLY